MKVAGEHRLGSLYEFMARTGLRRGEALGLCREDVENAEGYLIVRTALVQVGSGVVEGEAKTDAGESRRVALASDTLGLLMIHRLTQEVEQERWGSACRSCGHGGRVFAREDGSDLFPEHATKTFARLGDGIRTRGAVVGRRHGRSGPVADRASGCQGFRGTLGGVPFALTAPDASGIRRTVQVAGGGVQFVLGQDAWSA